MSDGIESVGAMATAGLVASTLDGPDAHGSAAHGACANCGAKLKGGFCHACGQPAHVHRSMLHIVEEFFHGILHFDSKAWRTLPLLMFRPGLLTYNYIHGHRVRYVTPMAMFLFSVFLMFMVFSMLGGATSVPVAVPPTEQTQTLEKMRAGLEEAKVELAEAEAELAAAAAVGEDTKTEQKLRDRAQRQVEKAQISLDAFSSAMEETGIIPPVPPAVPEAGSDPAPPAIPGPPAVTQTLPELIAKNVGDDFNINVGTPEFQAKIKKKLQNPELLLYKIQNTAYKFSWMLIPISLPFLWLLFFWKRGVAMYDHAIFSLYSLSFMSILFIIVSLLYKFTDGWDEVIGMALTFAPPIHMFAQLQGTYRLSFFSAFWRTVALLFITLTASITFLVFIVSMGVAG